MRRLIALLAVAALAGCSAPQLAALEADGTKAAQAAQAVIVSFEAHEATLSEVAAALVKAAPPSGALHDLAADAQTAEATLAAHPEALAAAKGELAKIAPVTASK